MKGLKIRNIILGEGIPKICSSIVGITQEEIIKQAEELYDLSVDIIEWRVDWYEKCYNVEAVLKVLGMLRPIVEDKPMIFTIRTLDEGGEKAFDIEKYCELNIAAAQSGLVDIIDVEALRDEGTFCKLVEQIHHVEKYVIASNHDFQQTPTKEEIIRRLTYMQEKGADILKIAVMPQSRRDVLTLLEATVEMIETKATKPVVTMSMSGKGVVSRIAGEIFGSAMTFGTGRNASAPGQLDVNTLHTILNVLHH